MTPIKKDRSITRLFLGVCTGLLISSSAAGQMHTPHQPQNRQLFLAEELFNRGLYKNAYISAQQYLDIKKYAASADIHADADKAKYLIAVSKLQLDEKDAISDAEKYISTTANPAYKQRAAYALAQNYFKKNMYAEAISYYELADIYNLDNQEVINAKFELAYCYFNNSQFSEAEPLLASVRELGGKYYDAGNYYYGLLAYNKNNYKDALTSFERIENKPEYVNIVPYYVAEIHYYTGNKQKALQDALRLIRRPDKSFYHNELHLLVAQVHFEDKAFEEALPYFEHYYDNTDRIRKEDLYEMAYCYYRLNKWEDAIDYFQQLSETRDSLGQSSMYLLGDCYLKTNDKKSARNAFSICSDMPFNRGQKEASLLLSAKISYELGYNNDAIYYINLLTADFPDTKYNDEAKTLLSDLLIRTSNYAEAYEALQDVSEKSDNYNRIYQKVTYGYAMQQIQMGNRGFADTLLSNSLAVGNDLTYKTAATFWKADLAYRNARYNEAIDYGRSFLNSNTNKSWAQHLSPSATDRNMYITLGYAAMELSKFSEAQDYFSKARFQADTSADASFIAATWLREADAVFMQKDYKAALTLYDKVIAAQSPDADYARFQKAIIMGLIGNNKAKAELLTELVNAKPASRYTNEARYELGLTYIEEDKYLSAVTAMMPLTEAYEVRNMAPKAWMKIGFAYQQAGKESKAIESYKTIVSEYPTSEERAAALDALKSLYIQAGQPDEYAKLLSENNLGGTEQNVLDSAYYATAEAQYAANNWAKAKTLLGEYLSKYPNGVFISKANYYKAESHYQLKEYKDALTGYDFILNNAWSNFSENSARRAAVISFEQKNMTDAKKYYGMLRNMAMGQDNLQAAYNGLMLSSYELNELSTAAAYADTVLTLDGSDKNIKENALLIKAKALMQEGNAEAALPVYKQLEKASASATAAEARYNVAYIFYLQGKLKEAEEAAGNNIQLSGSNEYWLVKSYILISDILTQQKDYFNAKATLQSVIKNCKIAELKTEATNKLKEVKQLENKNSKLSE